MADIIDGKIFDGKNYEDFSYGNEFSNVFYTYNPDEVWLSIISVNTNKNSLIYYRVEGIENNELANIVINRDDKIFYSSKLSNDFEFRLYGNIEDYTLLVNGVTTDIIQSGIYGEIIGNVNIKNCGITNPEDIEIICLRNDSKRLIGRYDVINGVYKIPNLDAEAYYDIILVDKSRKIEQQVLSYRKPTPY